MCHFAQWLCLHWRDSFSISAEVECVYVPGCVYVWGASHLSVAAAPATGSHGGGVCCCPCSLGVCVLVVGWSVGAWVGGLAGWPATVGVL